jgi:hypothetical protein
MHWFGDADAEAVSPALGERERRKELCFEPRSLGSKGQCCCPGIYLCLFIGELCLWTEQGWRS